MKDEFEKVDCRVEYHATKQYLDCEGNRVVRMDSPEVFAKAEDAIAYALQKGYVKSKFRNSIWEKRAEFKQIEVSRKVVEIPTYVGEVIVVVWDANGKFFQTWTSKFQNGDGIEHGIRISKKIGGSYRIIKPPLEDE